MGRKRKKLGSLAIQIHFTVDAEKQGRILADRIQKWFPNISLVEDAREGEQVYSTITLRIW